MGNAASGFCVNGARLISHKDDVGLPERIHHPFIVVHVADSITTTAPHTRLRWGTMRASPNKFVTLGFSIAALASSTIPILCIALAIMGIVFSRKLIATEKVESQAPSVMPRVSLALSILALAITLGLMAFALPVALGW